MNASEVLTRKHYEALNERERGAHPQTLGSIERTRARCSHAKHLEALNERERGAHTQTLGSIE